MLDLRFQQPPNDYPDGDGKPMAETDDHRDQMVELIETLKSHFRVRNDVYVSGNLLWFYAEGDRRRHVSPDVLVRLGTPTGLRRNYLQWLEGGAPQVVFELTSKSTRREDTHRKYELYLRLGVEEYYLFDPLNEYLRPRFRSYHRHSGRFVPVLGEMVFSPCLGLELLVQNEKLRIRVPGQKDVLSTPQEAAREAEARAEDAEARAEGAEARAEAAERELERLRALLNER